MQGSGTVMVLATLVAAVRAEDLTVDGILGITIASVLLGCVCASAPGHLNRFSLTFYSPQVGLRINLYPWFQTVPRIYVMRLCGFFSTLICLPPVRLGQMAGLLLPRQP